MTGEFDVWPELIERLKIKLGARSYAELARDLEMSVQKLADARKGRQELPSEVKAQILGLLGDPVSKELYESVFPRRLRDDVAAHIDGIYDPKREEQVTDDFWIRRLDDLKALLDDVPDSIVAANVGVSQSMISAARRGTGVLSPGAKLKILDRLGYMASRDLLCDLLPPKAAARLREFEKLRFIAKAKRRTKQ